MSGLDPFQYMQQVARKLPEVTDPGELADLLDEVEYLFEIIPVEMQEPAEQLIRQIRDKLQALK